MIKTNQGWDLYFEKLKQVDTTEEIEALLSQARAEVENKSLSNELAIKIKEKKNGIVTHKRR